MDDFGGKTLQVAVAQIVQDCGYEGVHGSTCVALTDIARRFMETVAAEARSRADIARRAEANVGDLRSAIDAAGINAHEMHYLFLRSKLEPAGPEVDFPVPPPEVAAAAKVGRTALSVRFGEPIKAGAAGDVAAAAAVAAGAAAAAAALSAGDMMDLDDLAVAQATTASAEEKSNAATATATATATAAAAADTGADGVEKVHVEGAGVDEGGVGAAAEPEEGAWWRIGAAAAFTAGGPLLPKRPVSADCRPPTEKIEERYPVVSFVGPGLTAAKAAAVQGEGGDTDGGGDGDGDGGATAGTAAAAGAAAATPRAAGAAADGEAGDYSAKAASAPFKVRLSLAPGAADGADRAAEEFGEVLRRREAAKEKEKEKEKAKELEEKGEVVAERAAAVSVEVAAGASGPGSLSAPQPLSAVTAAGAAAAAAAVAPASPAKKRKRAADEEAAVSTTAATAATAAELPTRPFKMARQETQGAPAVSPSGKTASTAKATPPVSAAPRRDSVMLKLSVGGGKGGGSLTPSMSSDSFSAVSSEKHKKKKKKKDKDRDRERRSSVASVATPLLAHPPSALLTPTTMLTPTFGLGAGLGGAGARVNSFFAPGMAPLFAAPPPQPEPYTAAERARVVADPYHLKRVKTVWDGQEYFATVILDPSKNLYIVEYEGSGETEEVKDMKAAFRKGTFRYAPKK